MSENTSTPQPSDPAPPGPDQTNRPEQDTGSRALGQALKISFGFLKFAMLGLIAVYFLSGFFYVRTEEVKIRLTFGRPSYVGEKVVVFGSDSGWHYKWPWQEVVTVSTVAPKKDAAEEYTGVRLNALLDLAGAGAEGTLTIVADDGYEAEMALADARAEGQVAYLGPEAPRHLRPVVPAVGRIDTQGGRDRHRSPSDGLAVFWSVYLHGLDAKPVP